MEEGVYDKKYCSWKIFPFARLRDGCVPPRKFCLNDSS